MIQFVRIERFRKVKANSTTFGCGQVFDGMKRKDSNVGQRAGFLPLIMRTEGMGGIRETQHTIVANRAHLRK